MQHDDSMREPEGARQLFGRCFESLVTLAALIIACCRERSRTSPGGAESAR